MPMPASKRAFAVGDLVRTGFDEKARITKIEEGLPSKVHYEIVEYADGSHASPGHGNLAVSDGSNLAPWVPRIREADEHIRPKHYGGPNDPYEPLKVMLAQHGRDAVVNFCWLTAEKYLARAGKKQGEPIERDFRKAAFYLMHAADLLENKT